MLRPQTLGVFVPLVRPSPSPTPTPWRTACASTAPWRLWPRGTWRVRRWLWDHYQRGKQHCRDGKTHAEVWLVHTRGILGRLASWLFQMSCYKLHHWNKIGKTKKICPSLTLHSLYPSSWQSRLRRERQGIQRLLAWWAVGCKTPARQSTVQSDRNITISPYMQSYTLSPKYLLMSQRGCFLYQLVQWAHSR